jgi:hypothetical protein
MTKTVVDVEVLDVEIVADALNTSPYGVCVYEAGNDVVDHQTVTLEYEGGVTASVVMSACQYRSHLAPCIQADISQSLRRNARDRLELPALKAS